MKSLHSADGENDVSLFDVVENSFAMGQAKAYVKEAGKICNSFK